MTKKHSFVKATKGKVILALFLACFALFVAWSISKVVFQEMLDTVDDVSAPSQRLKLVNTISRKISSLDQQQKKQAIKSPGNYNKLFKESLQLRNLIDSLAYLYAEDSLQVARLKIIKTLVVKRDKQFFDYLRVRTSLINDNTFSNQVKQLSTLVAKGSLVDSTVLATEEHTSTTTFSPEKNESRSFFAKLFGKKKEAQDKSFTIISEQKIKRDTIALSPEEAIARSVQTTLKSIEENQRQRNNRFVNREAILADANSALIVQMLEVLTKVENEVVHQIESNALIAKDVVDSGINRITVVMIVFFLITIILLWLILTDISRSNSYRLDLEVAKDEAEYHGQAKQRFLANMSHEIRTPLQSIIGYSELLLTEQKYNKHYVGAISRSSEHLLQIVNEVLDYNRIISGKFSFQVKPFNMRELLDEVLSLIKPQIASRSLKLVIDFKFNPDALIAGDSFRLKQILLNLLGNAIKFTEIGTITLSVDAKIKDDQAHFTFSIKDTGVGMSEEDKIIVFNEFEQSKVKSSVNANQEGAGLGLTIVKALVENQNGRIYLESKLGMGTVFTFFLTFDVIKVFDKPKYNDNIRLRLPLGTIWVIDDDPLIFGLCEIIFRNNNLSFKVFSSANDLLQEPIPDDLAYVLMDLRMPEMDGSELCRRLRENISSDIEIIAMTAQVVPSEQSDILTNGFDALLMKPFKSEDLLSLISEELEIDFSALRKMTLNDPDLLNSIVQGFVVNCEDDQELLSEALRINDWDSVTLIIHRLAGRIGQMGISYLPTVLRGIELDLRANQPDTKALLNNIKASIKHLNLVIAKLKVGDLNVYSIS